MNNYFLILGLLIVGLTFSSCGDKGDTPVVFDGDWETLNPVPFTSRVGAVSFVIGDRAYAGLGYDEFGQNKRDFFRYDPENDTWIPVKSFPSGLSRTDAVAFSVLGKGYVATGVKKGSGAIGDQLYGDLWEYDPAANDWSQKADFMGGARKWAVAFATDSLAFVGTGQGTSANRLKDFYAYDPLTDTWAEIADFGGAERIQASSMSLLNKGYVGGGLGSTDWWEYDVVNDFWSKKRDFPGLVRSGAVSFSIDNKGYMGLGFSGSDYFLDFYEYHAHSDVWEQQKDFSAEGRGRGIGFAIGEEGFICAGENADNTYNEAFKYLP